MNLYFAIAAFFAVVSALLLVWLIRAENRRVREVRVAAALIAASDMEWNTMFPPFQVNHGPPRSRI